jgi:hypothetical protein
MGRTVIFPELTNRSAAMERTTSSLWSRSGVNIFSCEVIESKMREHSSVKVFNTVCSPKTDSPP